MGTGPGSRVRGEPQALPRGGRGREGPGLTGRSETLIYGYARVSTTDQKEDRQIAALVEAGVPEYHIIVDKQSGKDFERPNYKY
ncbi:MAG: recombinase family protein, partial [Oscillospiraceae bacterium]|nr:recombinase family protein [Oscillospiraceae bacterium]